MVSSFLRAISHGLEKIDSHWKRHFFCGLGDSNSVYWFGAYHEINFIATYSQKYRNGGKMPITEKGHSLFAPPQT